MSPELFDKDMSPLSLAKSDVFSIGVVLFNLLTGAYPFNSVHD